MHRDARFRLLMDTVPVLVWCADPDRSCVYFNRVWLDFTGRSMEQELGFGWEAGVHPDDDARRAGLYTEHFSRREPFRIEYRLRRHDGAWRWMLGTGVPRSDPVGAFAGFIGSCIDVTELKQAEQQRRHDLDEKAALLQELHHRVKNNAQVFASLLGVQASRAHDPAVQAALRAAAARASTMAIAQQQIWDCGSSARFDLAGLVRRLVRSVGGGEVALELEASEPMLVPLATAVPLGLIIHELLTNAIRHGYPDGGPGRIEVRLRRDGPARICVVVADDGVGMRHSVTDPGGRSVGLTIVRSLARQIGATLATGGAAGTTVCVNLPCPSPA